MNSKQQKLTRQHARFQCQDCQKFGAFAQYAHIVPGALGGEYNFNNLLFLCYDCHRKFESMIAQGALSKARIEQMQKIKGRQNIDRLVEGIFDELLADSDVLVRLGRGITIKNSIRAIQEGPIKHPDPAYLSVTADNGKLAISGFLKDENDRPLIRFDGLQFRLFTGDFWDIIRKPGRLEITNKSRKIRLIFSQNNDLSLSILGVFFVAGQEVHATEEKFIVGGKVHVDCTYSNNQVGIIIE